MLGLSTVSECNQFGSTSNAKASSPACPNADATMAAMYPPHPGRSLSLWGRFSTVLVRSFFFGGRLLRDHSDVIDAGRLDRRHGADHFAISDLLIGPNEHLQVGTSLRYRLQLIGQFARVELAIVEIGLAIASYRDDELLFLALERGGLNLGNRNLDALLNDGRGHHEDDQQHQHHIDQRGHIDLRG